MPVRVIDVLVFVLELTVYAAAVVFAVSLDSAAWARVLVAVTLLVVLGVAWGRFAAPRATRPLQAGPRVVFEAAWFGSGALFFWGARRFGLALLVLGAAVVIATWRARTPRHASASPTVAGATDETRAERR